MSERVLVTNVDERSALAACRGLAAAGYTVVGASSVRPAAGHWSRSVAERILVPDPTSDPEGFVGALRGAAAVIPGTDAALEAVSELRDRMAPDVRAGLPPREAVERSLDKIALAEEGERAGLPCPPTIACNDVADAERAAAELGFPVVVKPGRSFIREGAQLVRRNAAVVRDAGELAAAAAQAGTPFIVQSLEPDPVVVSLAGVFADGRLLGFAVSRYLRTWPPRAGNAACSVTIDPPPGVREQLEGLLKGMGWEGIFELECFERPDGSLLSVDLNPRIYGSMSLAIAAGANLPALWVDAILGKDPAPATARAGVYYRWEEAELRHLLWQLRRGNVKDAAAVLRPHRHTVHAFARATDPAPLLPRPLGLAAKLVSRVRGARERG